LDSLPDWVCKPQYRRDVQRRRIVHLGIGAFHRAHQAFYTDDAMNAGDRDWSITGVSLRSPGVRDSLAPQDCLYSVVEKGSGREAIRIVGSVDQVLVGPEDPPAVIARIADPATAVVTLTVTEKGYYSRSDTGGLLLDSPEISKDLKGHVPKTIYGYITRGLILRRLHGGAGLTLVSCDNLAGNGQLLERGLADFIDRRDPTLTSWVSDNVRCPNTMVDRIVPVPTAADRDEAEASMGIRDEALVVTEPFRQWVIEDRFAGPRPKWEAGGAQLVEDVAPFELAKLRLLNGSHSTLAYIGRALGLDYVHQAVADAQLGRFVREQMLKEAAPNLRPARGLDPEAYGDTILKRFGNAALPYSLAQIAMDGSQKVPQRWLATIIERATTGRDSPHHMLSLAAWIAYTRGRSAAAPAYVVDDPLRHDFAALWNNASGDLRALVERFVRTTGIFPRAFCERDDLIDQLAALLNDWMEQGPRATLQRHLEKRRETCPQP
jgi:fructuronate reductase